MTLDVPSGLIDRVRAGVDRTPLLLLHGFLGHSEDWRPVIGALGGSRRCIALDLPGHGSMPESVPLVAHPFEHVVDRIVQRMLDLDLHRFDAMGYSMGGRLVLGLMCRHPERVRRAIAIGASAGIEGAESRAARRTLDLERAAWIEARGLESFLEEWYAQPLFRSLRQDASFPSIFERRRAGDGPSLAAALRALSTGCQPELQGYLARNPVPLLLIAGADDEKYVTSNRVLATVCPRVRTATVPGSGHSVHLEKPGAVAELATTFLDESEELKDG